MLPITVPLPGAVSGPQAEINQCNFTNLAKTQGLWVVSTGGNSDILILPSFIMLVISKTCVLKKDKGKEKESRQEKIKGNFIVALHLFSGGACIRNDQGRQFSIAISSFSG